MKPAFTLWKILPEPESTVFIAQQLGKGASTYMSFKGACFQRYNWAIYYIFLVHAGPKLELKRSNTYGRAIRTLHQVTLYTLSGIECILCHSVQRSKLKRPEITHSAILHRHFSSKEIKLVVFFAPWTFLLHPQGKPAFLSRVLNGALKELVLFKFQAWENRRELERHFRAAEKELTTRKQPKRVWKVGKFLFSKMKSGKLQTFLSFFLSFLFFCCFLFPVRWCLFSSSFSFGARWRLSWTRWEEEKERKKEQGHSKHNESCGC